MSGDALPPRSAPFGLLGGPVVGRADESIDHLLLEAQDGEHDDSHAPAGDSRIEHMYGYVPNIVKRSPATTELTAGRR